MFSHPMCATDFAMQQAPHKQIGGIIIYTKYTIYKALLDDEVKSQIYNS